MGVIERKTRALHRSAPAKGRRELRLRHLHIWKKKKQGVAR
jgi:hypothetical protein